jgi:uncharacterized protein DUF4913
VDHEYLTKEAPAAALPGLQPLIQRAVIQALAQHTAGVTAPAVARHVADQDLAATVEQALQQKLVDLAEPAGPYFSTLPEWVEQWLLPLYRRSLHGHHRMWCPQWWRHDEAVARLDALWRAWEHLRLEPATGLSVWFRDHADHHMTILLDADGPFKGCDATHSNRPLHPLPHEPPPSGTFEPDDNFVLAAPIHPRAGVPGHSPAAGQSLKAGRVR